MSTCPLSVTVENIADIDEKHTIRRITEQKLGHSGVCCPTCKISYNAKKLIMTKTLDSRLQTPIRAVKLFKSDMYDGVKC